MDVTKVAMFWLRVDKTGECWLWTGVLNDRGYGVFGGDRAHRISWRLANGPIPVDLCVLHRCDTPACIRPDHLFLGTKGDNNRDRSAKGRNAPQRGDHNNGRKLDSDAVTSIRVLIAERVPQQEIARRFSVSRTTISAIATGRSWSV